MGIEEAEDEEEDKAAGGEEEITLRTMVERIDRVGERGEEDAVVLLLLR
jgi:hypothetical protein